VLTNTKRDIPERLAIDFKTTSMQDKRLIPFDNQLLGYAIAHQANKMLMVVFYLNPRAARISGRLKDIVRLEESVRTDLVDEWRIERRMEIDNRYRYSLLDVWPKRAPDACFAWNRVCQFYNFCQAGKARKFMLESK